MLQIFNICPIHYIKRKAIQKFCLDAKRTLLLEGNKTRFFSYVNTRLRKSRGLQITLQSDGSVLTIEAVAEALNKEFCKNFSATALPSAGCSRDSRSCVDGLRFTCSMYDVISALKKCSNTTAGPCIISFATLKQITPQIANPFLVIFQQLLHKSVFLERWKRAKVMPLYRGKVEGLMPLRIGQLVYVFVLTSC